MLGNLFKKKNSNEEEVQALIDIALLVLKTAEAVLNDVAAARRGETPDQTRLIDPQAIAKRQAAPRAGASYMMLGRLSEKSISYDDMVNLFYIQGDAALFRAIFLSPKMTAAYFGEASTTNAAAVVNETFDRFFLRALIIASNFLLAGSAHKKGYLAKMFMGQLSDAEAQDYRGLIEIVGQEFRKRAAVGRSMSADPARFEKMVAESAGRFNSMPVVVEMKAEFCRPMNDIWLEAELADKTTQSLAEMQAQAMMSRAS